MGAEPPRPAHAVPQHGAHGPGDDSGRCRPPHGGVRRPPSLPCRRPLGTDRGAFDRRVERRSSGRRGAGRIVHLVEKTSGERTTRCATAVCRPMFGRWVRHHCSGAVPIASSSPLSNSARSSTRMRGVWCAGRASSPVSSWSSSRDGSSPSRPSGAHRILGRGECFGALASPGQPRAEPEGVAAVTASVLFVVGRNEFAGLVEACPTFGARFSSNGSFVLRRLEHQRLAEYQPVMRSVG